MGVDEGAATAAEIFGTGAITSMYLDAHRAGPGNPDDVGHVAADVSSHPGRDIDQE